MAEKNMRIIDFEGLPAPGGRVEFRNAGMWGSACAKNCNAESTRAICRELGYLDGTMKNPDGGEICDGYLGENFCGAKPSMIHYMAFKCDPGAAVIMDCYRELADGCEHE